MDLVLSASSLFGADFLVLGMTASSPVEEEGAVDCFCSCGFPIENETAAFSLLFGDGVLKDGCCCGFRLTMTFFLCLLLCCLSFLACCCCSFSLRRFSCHSRSCSSRDACFELSSVQNIILSCLFLDSCSW